MCSSSLINRKTKCSSFFKSLYNLFSEGISALHGGHHEAQKLIRTTLPFKESAVIIFPSLSVTENEGAGESLLAVCSVFILALNKPVDIILCNSHDLATALKRKNKITA